MEYSQVRGTDFYFGESIYRHLNPEEIKQKLKEKYDDTVFPCIIRSRLGYFTEDKMHIFSVREGSDNPYIISTYHFIYSKDRQEVMKSISNNKAIHTYLCYPPHGVYAIKVMGRPTRKELLDIVKAKYYLWLHDQKEFWNGNDRLIIAIFNKSLDDWYIAETIKPDPRFVKQDFSMRVKIVPANEWNFERRSSENAGEEGESNGD